MGRGREKGLALETTEIGEEGLFQVGVEQSRGERIESGGYADDELFLIRRQIVT